MPQVLVLPCEEFCQQGAALQVEPGVCLCDALLDSGAGIEHACEKSCACTACHVIILEGFKSLAPAEEPEENMLGKAWGLEPTFCLSCRRW